MERYPGLFIGASCGITIFSECFLAAYIDLQNPGFMAYASGYHPRWGFVNAGLTGIFLGSIFQKIRPP
jgi:hypothetical protein